MDDIEKQFELERQLHEQYAINANQSSGIFVTFTVALFALLGFYGYAYLLVETKNVNYPLISKVDFFILFIVVEGILLFLSMIAAQLGYAQRRDQFIIDKIRRKSYAGNIHFVTKEYETLFLGYDPLKSLMGLRKFLPGFYNLFFWLFQVIMICVFVLTVFKALYYNLGYSCIIMILIVVVCISCVLGAICFLCGKRKKIIDSILVENKKDKLDITASNVLDMLSSICRYFSK